MIPEPANKVRSLLASGSGARALFEIITEDELSLRYAQASEHHMYIFRHNADLVRHAGHLDNPRTLLHKLRPPCLRPSVVIGAHGDDLAAEALLGQIKHARKRGAHCVAILWIAIGPCDVHQTRLLDVSACAF